MIDEKYIATFATTTSYEGVAPIFNPRVFANGAFRVPPLAPYPVRVSINPEHGAASDSLSKILAAGEYLTFSLINLNKVSIKSIGGDSELEFEGDLAA